MVSKLEKYSVQLQKILKTVSVHHGSDSDADSDTEGTETNAIPQNAVNGKSKLVLHVRSDDALALLNYPDFKQPEPCASTVFNLNECELFLTAAYNGDPNVQYFFVRINNATVRHSSNINFVLNFMLIIVMFLHFLFS